MKLSAYTELIKHLPYKDQAFETSKETWKKYKGSKPFNLFFNEIFGSNATAVFSRGDLFVAAKNDFNNTVFSIVMWGYPRNMRGNSFSKLLLHLDLLKEMIGERKKLTVNEFELIQNKLKGTGIGLSTLTKFLYFFNLHINEYRCLILDSRIVSVLSEQKFEELSGLKNISEFNKEKIYVDYLKTMKAVSLQYGYSVDQLELFLFMFGNNLKDSIEES